MILGGNVDIIIATKLKLKYFQLMIAIAISFSCKEVCLCCHVVHINVKPQNGCVWVLTEV